MILNDAFVFTHRKIIADSAIGSRLPSVYGFSEFVDAGGFMGYGAVISDTYRRAAAYVDRILKGAKPRDLPVEHPTKFELVINLKTAKALALTIPPVAAGAGGSGHRVVDRRRFLLTSLAGALAAPLVAAPQQAGKVWRIGWLAINPFTSLPSEAFLQGLRDHGYVEGQNVIIERRYCGGSRGQAHCIRG